MARVTVEDCVLKIPNRFDLVMMAAQRARDIAAGASLSLDRDNDKNPVVALREIADETIGLPQLNEALVRSFQRHVESDEPEEDRELSAGEHPWEDAIASQVAEKELAEGGLEVEGEGGEESEEVEEPTAADIADTEEE